MKRVRLFVALIIPLDIQKWLAQSFAGVAVSSVIVRRVPEDQLHLTLLFLGETAHDTIDRVKAAISSGCRGSSAISLVTSRGITIPPQSPRVAAAAVERSASLDILQSSIAKGCRGIGSRTMQTHAFRPHITVARTPQGATLSSAVALQIMQWAPRLAWRSADVGLYESELTPYGSNYTLVHSMNLTEQ